MSLMDWLGLLIAAVVGIGAGWLYRPSVPHPEPEQETEDEAAE